jgi:phospholipase/carboxylesterase
VFDVVVIRLTLCGLASTGRCPVHAILAHFPFTADAAEMSRSYLAQSEAGKCHVSLRIFAKLSAALCAEPAEVLRRHSTGLPPMPGPAHAHSFLLGADSTRAALVLLHGSSGTESDLIPLADELAPRASKLCTRRTVAIDGAFALFHRFPDEAVIAAKVPVVAEFIEASSARYGLARPPIAIGFSNGPIVAAAPLLTHPGLLAGAILLRPLSPFGHDLPHRLDSTPILILDGEKESRRSSGGGLRLAEKLVRAGAAVTHHALPVGHVDGSRDSGWRRWSTKDGWEL